MSAEEAVGPSSQYFRLAGMSNREVERVLVQGETPDPGALVGWEYMGANTPPAAAVLRIRKFIKGFIRDPATDAVVGYNTPVRQGSLEEPWRARPSEAAPKRFAFFAVAPVEATSRDNAYLHATLLDYGRGANRRWGIASRIRDYLVRVEPGSDDILLGKAYLAFSSLRLPVSYFVLQRYRTGS
jgi:hypothetical protein